VTKPLSRDTEGHARLLADKDIARWYNSLSEGSKITSKVYLRQLDNFCEKMKTTPKELLEKDEGELHRMILDFISSWKESGHAGSYTHSMVKSVRSWLAHNGIRITRPIKIGGSQDTPTLKDERVPTQEELRRILLSAGPRDRVSCVLIAHSGLRLETIGNADGTDGLRMGDLPDLKIDGEKVEFKSIPIRIVVRKELSKAKHSYITFLGQEGCEYLKSYLEDRLRSGEALMDGSPVIASRWQRRKVSSGGKGKESLAFLWSNNISDSIKGAIRTAGFQLRPYVLRAYFDTQLLMAENRGKIAHDYRVFWMGHRGSIEARYTTNKGRLPQSLLDDMRTSYEESESFLSTIPLSGDASSVSSIARVMLAGLGYEDGELDGRDLSDLAVLQEMVRTKVQPAQGNGNRQKVIHPRDLPEYLNKGWRFMAKVNEKMAIVSPPDSSGS
jgi:integrase